MSDTPHAPSPPTLLNRFVDPAILDHIALRPSPDVQGTNMDGETVLLDLGTGRYYTLNRLGSVIWEHCTGDNSISDIHEVLCNRFDVAPSQPRRRASPSSASVSSVLTSSVAARSQKTLSWHWSSAAASPAYSMSRMRSPP